MERQLYTQRVHYRPESDLKVAKIPVTCHAARALNQKKAAKQNKKDHMGVFMSANVITKSDDLIGSLYSSMILEECGS